jgi:hypothetical protein
MKTPAWNLIALTLIATLSATIAQSKFSGIYSAIASPREKVLLAITKGGHILGLSNKSSGLREALDPARSTINADGKIKAVVGDGTTINATVSSDFKLKGTGKSSDGDTFRITGSRTLN